MFLKEFFEKLILKKKKSADKNHEKLPSMQRVNLGHSILLLKMLFQRFFASPQSDQRHFYLLVIGKYNI